jgi:hypothetical protein
VCELEEAGLRVETTGSEWCGSCGGCGKCYTPQITGQHGEWEVTAQWCAENEEWTLAMWQNKRNIATCTKDRSDLVKVLKRLEVF